MDPLDCPICLEPFEAKIYQCNQGHAFCGDCEKRLQARKCAQCKEALPTTDKLVRNRVAESLAEKREYKCPRQCGSTVRNHDCPRAPIPCPWRFCRFDDSKDCQFESADPEAVAQHLEAKHSTIRAGPLDRNIYCLTYSGDPTACFGAFFHDPDAKLLVWVRSNMGKQLTFTPISYAPEAPLYCVSTMADALPSIQVTDRAIPLRKARTAMVEDERKFFLSSRWKGDDGDWAMLLTLGETLAATRGAMFEAFGEPDRKRRKLRKVCDEEQEKKEA